MHVEQLDMSRKNKYYTIFVVEDSDVYRSILVQDLESENEVSGSNIRYNVFGFSSGEECMEQIALKKPDIMITDYLLDGNGYITNMNGFELLKSITNLFPKLDVIVLSCHENTRVIKELMRAGIKKYIRKEKLGRHQVKKAVFELIQQREGQNKLVKYSLAAAALVILVLILLVLF